ncbi:MAG TPA: SLC13 family permease [Pyrinomonadaceae bacterium]|jgi:di/tricarboxylate transporter|nr:SLC13 family permease [Pyrinomonadaceae bacterium]
MSPIAVTLLLLLLAVTLFAIEKIPVDIVAILLVIALVMSGVLTVQEGVAGFGNDIIITIAGLFVLTGGLVKTGIVDMIGRRLHKIAGNNEFLLTTLIMTVAALAASVLKNTTTTAMLVPVVMGLASRAKIAPSKLLMPLAFGAILGGTCTLIGTSTNLAVSGAMQRYQMQPFSMFELTPVGLAIVGVGMLYMLFVGRKLIPRYEGADSLTDQYHIREYISEVLVLPDSNLVGKTLKEANFYTEYILNVIGIIRDKHQRLSPSAGERIEAGDLLIVEGKMQDILAVKAEAGIEIKPDFKLNDNYLQGGDVELFEVMVMRGSTLVGQNLKTLRLRQRYELTVLAISRHKQTFLEKLSQIQLRFGDVLLVQGRRDLIEPLVVEGEIILLEEVSERGRREDKQKWAMLAFTVFLSLSLSKYLTLGMVEVPLAMAVLIGALILLASQTIRYNELYSLIEWRLIVLIACMISFGTAMEKTGADKYLADLINFYFGQYGAVPLLAGFFILTVGLTQPMSNQAAALVVLPIAVQSALALGLNPRTFAVAVTYAASCSFITPLEPACVLIYTPGRYRFFDFVKVGTILTIAVFVVVIWLVPMIWKL